MTTIAALPEGTGSRPEPIDTRSPMDAALAPAGLASRRWFALTAALLIVLYSSTILMLAQRWMDDPNYAHGFLVPLISGWLAWRWYRRQAAPSERRRFLGGMEIVAGGLLHLAAMVVVWPPLDFAGLVLIFRGAALAVGGRAWASGLGFPTFFLFFMFPLPVGWTGALAIWLQEVVSWVSAGVLDLFWVCHRSGHSLYLAGLDRPLVVAEECSGLRQLVAFVALAALIGYLAQGTLRSRSGLVLAAVPVAIGANVLRVLLMAIGAKYFGAGWMASWLHDAPALVTLPIGVGLLLMLALLTSRQPVPNVRPSHWAGLSGKPAAAKQSFVFTSAMLAVLVLAQFGLEAHLRASGPAAYPELRLPLDQLPSRLSLDPTVIWDGGDAADLDELRSRVRFADQFIARTYRASSSRAAVRLYAVYSRSGDDREHHPEICIRDVGGAAEDASFHGLVYLDAACARPVQRFRFRTGSGRYLTVYYWHYTLDPAPVEGQSLLQALHQRLGRRLPSVTLQVATDADPGAIGEVVQSFVVAVDRTMTDLILPPTARIGCERLPIRLLD
jgi:exosortase